MVDTYTVLQPIWSIEFQRYLLPGDEFKPTKMLPTILDVFLRNGILEGPEPVYPLETLGVPHEPAAKLADYGVVDRLDLCGYTIERIAELADVDLDTAAQWQAAAAAEGDVKHA